MENPLEADVKLVVETFAQKESRLFSDFSDVWRDLHCPELYWHGYDCVQKFEVVEQLLRFSIQYALKKEGSCYSRLGGLYLAYVLHFTQPCHPKAMIRVTLYDYEVLKTYHAEVKEQKLIQADYMLSKLKVNSAFSICCTPLPMCISKQKRKLYSANLVQDLRPTLDNVLKDMKSVLGTKVEDYSNLKQSLSTYLPQHLLSDSPVPQEIDKCLRQFTETRKKLEKHATSDDAVLEAPNSD